MTKNRLSHRIFAGFVFLLALPLSIIAQIAPCGASSYENQLFAQKNGLRETALRTEAKVFEAISHKKAVFRENITTVLPVVFHIISENGIGAATDLQVLAALDLLNNSFAHADEYDAPNGGLDTKFAFCLARRDPDNQATNGITRTESPLTNVEINQTDTSLKNLIRWNPLKYINVWVVNSIADSQGAYPNLAGYSTLPYLHGSDYDGIVLDVDYVGTFPNSMVFAHEMGHYLGLLHTFNGGCKNDDCLLDGDHVCDTPPDAGVFTACGFNSCNTDTNAPAPNPFTTDQPDPTDNFMDYTPFTCGLKFTAGQSERMHYFVENLRKSLFFSKTCLEPCPTPIVAAMQLPATPVAVGTTIQLLNQSTGGNQFDWYVNDALFSTAQSPTISVDLIGYYSILLVTKTDDPRCSETTEGYFQSICNIGGSLSVSSAEILTGKSVQFSSNTTQNGSSFEWKIDGLVVGTGVDLDYSFPDAGTFTVQLEVKNAFCREIFTKTIQVFQYCQSLIPAQWEYTGSFDCGLEVKYSFATPNGDLWMVGDDCGHVMILKVNAAGQLLFAKKTDLNKYLYDAQLLDDQGMLLYMNGTGFPNNYQALLKIDSDGNVIFEKILPLYNFNNSGKSALKTDGTSIFIRNKWTADSTDFEYYFLFLDEMGAIQKTQRIGTENNWEGITIAAAEDGNYFVAMGNNQIHTAQIIKINASGEFLWVKKLIGNQSFYYVTTIIPESDGGVSCFVVVDNWYEDNLAQIRLDSTGDLKWAKEFDPPEIGSSTYFKYIKKCSSGGYLMGASSAGFMAPGTTELNCVFKTDDFGSVQTAFKIQNSTINSGLSSGEFTLNTAEYWQGSIAAPLVRNDKSIVLVHANANGFAGGCYDKPAYVPSYNFFVTVDSGSATLLLKDTLLDLVVSNDSFFMNAYPSVGTYNACPQFPICAENCTNGIDDDRDGQTDCLDSDCNCFQNPVGCTADSVSFLGFSAKTAWVSESGFVHPGAVPMVADLNPLEDGVPEIIVTSAISDSSGISNNSALIFKGNGANRNKPNKTNITNFGRNQPATQVAIGEISVTQNQKSEVVSSNYFPNGGDIILNNYKDTVGFAGALGTSFYFSIGNPAWRPQLADFDQDGVPEIYDGNRVQKFDLNGANNFGLLVNRIDGDTSLPNGRLAFQNHRFYTASPAAADLLTPSDCAGNPDCEGLELAAGPVIYSIDLHTFDGDFTSRNIARNLNSLNPSSVFGDGYTAIGDVNSDNQPDIVVAGTSNGVFGVYIWNKNGLIRFFPYPTNTPFSGGLPCIANVFDDRKLGFAKDFPEIIAASQNKLTCFNLNAANSGTPFWWSIETKDSLGILAATAFDFNADGLAELLIREEQSMRVLFGGAAPFPPGVASNRTIFSTPAAGLPWDSYPVVADCDGDGQAEILFTTLEKDSVNAIIGRLKVLKSNGNPWPNCRKIWNQYGYHATNITENLRIPAIEPKLGNQPAANIHFLGQMPEVDKLRKPFIRIPDAAVSIDSIWCGNKLTFARLKICNVGTSPLPDSLPIFFYDNDPTLYSPNQWGSVFYVKNALIAGDCSFLNISIPSANASYLYGMLNDKGQNARPFNLKTTFLPARGGLECGYENNFFKLFWTWETPPLDLGVDRSSCQSNAQTLDAGNDFAAYLWQDGSNSPTFTAPGPGKYWVKAFDECGFPQIDTVQITLAPNSQLDLGNDRKICLGDTVSLGLSGFDAVYWSPADKLPCAICPNFDFAPTETLTITATGVKNACFSSDSIRIFVSQSPVFTFSTSPEHDNQADGLATLMLSGGTPPFQIEWQTTPPQTGTIAQNLPTGTYFLTVTDAVGCTSIGQIFVDKTTATTYFLKENKFQIFPNPTNHHFFIENKQPKSEVFLQVEISNALGQKKAQRFIFSNKYLEIGCEKWPPGLYFIHILDDKKVIWQGKLVVVD